MDNNHLRKLCSVLVNSCDGYEEAWLPFFKLFYRFWPDCPFDIYLATQTKKFDDPKINVINTVGGAWSERLNKALKQINTPYVLFFLEDYFLLAPVKQKEMLKYLNYIVNDRNIGAFYFNKIGGFHCPSEKYDGFYDMNKQNITRYHLNCQIAIWNKKVFEDATSVIMNPWEFEINGFDLVPQSVRNHDFYCSEYTVHTMIKEEDIFTYLVHPKNGIGISKSKWLWNNRKLFKKHGIDCKCVTLERMSFLEYKFNTIKVNLIKYFCKPFLFKLIKKYHAK